MMMPLLWWPVQGIRSQTGAFLNDSWNRSHVHSQAAPGNHLLLHASLVSQDGGQRGGGPDGHIGGIFGARQHAFVEGSNMSVPCFLDFGTENRGRTAGAERVESGIVQQVDRTLAAVDEYDLIGRRHAARVEDELREGHLYTIRIVERDTRMVHDVASGWVVLIKVDPTE